ncbi:hypothetical protein M405DRAFT_819716 [Rhizopogon salebrosus TDB-379]|nr:hypothetical protein M405DRAFT_819716 [Rhizopogon salebrosus TDB-379]
MLPTTTIPVASALETYGTTALETPSSTPSRPLRALQPIILSSRRLQLQTGRGCDLAQTRMDGTCLLTANVLQFSDIL